MRTPRSLAAAFAVVVLVGSQLAALVHGAAVRHVTCALHGEQIDVALSLDGLERVDHCERSHIGTPQGQSSAHEDCELARLRGASADPPRHVPAIQRAAITAIVAAPVTADPVPPLELVLIAPKTSPPARA